MIYIRDKHNKTKTTADKMNRRLVMEDIKHKIMQGSAPANHNPQPHHLKHPSEESNQSNSKGVYQIAVRNSKIIPLAKFD